MKFCRVDSPFDHHSNNNLTLSICSADEPIISVEVIEYKQSHPGNVFSDKMKGEKIDFFIAL